MDEYIHFETTQPENLDKLADMVREKAVAAELDDEVPFDEGQPFKEYVAALHNYISDLKNMEVHTGLHIMGEAPKEEQLIEYLWLLLRLDNGEIPSLTQAIASMYGFDYYELLQNSSQIY